MYWFVAKLRAELSVNQINSKRVQKFRGWNLKVNLIHICFEGGAASYMYQVYRQVHC